jgi:hypothetical protein
MKSLTGNVVPFTSPLGTVVPHIKKCDGIILCDFIGIAKLLNYPIEKALNIAKERDLVTTVNGHVYCTADDFAFWADELPDAPLPAKALASKIHKTSATEMAYYFLFN